MGEPTATQVMLTLPPGMISLSAGGMEKRGGTRRTGADCNVGERSDVIRISNNVQEGRGQSSEMKFYRFQIRRQSL